MNLLPLDDYDHILVSYSGGKDSLACLLHLLDIGVPKEKIELWHQHVDGGKPGLMDWAVTDAYVRVTGEHFGIPVRFQWRDGGFEKEMLRDNEPTGGVYYQDETGRVIYLPAKRSQPGTRRKFPQTSADLSVRWCSAYLKIDVFARALNNDRRFSRAKVLVITGERRQESTARSKYAEVEWHRCDSRKRLVHAWRPVIDWSEEKVWEIIKKHRINPHPAYYLGWGRVSCLACIFGDNDQWASVREIDPERFQRIADYEAEFGTTIRRSLPVIEAADKGKEFISDKDKELIDLATGKVPYTLEHFRTVGEWVQPSGAFKRCGGPT